MTEPGALMAISLVAGAFVISWAGVGLFISWSLRRRLLDIPNERSSHTVPTPRGGGLIIAVTGLIGYVLIAWLFDTPFSVGYFLGATLVSLVSWIDDLYSLPFWSRLLVHIVAALALVADLGVWQTVPVPFSSSELQVGSVAGAILTLAWIVWVLNAYNFMDGIDGIAGFQAVVAGAAWASTAAFLGLNGITIFAAMIAAICFGFLIHNWQPARVFMGDVGSAYLGFTLAALPLIARAEARTELYAVALAAVLFVWFFLSDTVYTFVRRAVKGERVWEAHRTHLYQKMVIGGMSHGAVTLIYGLSAALVCLTVYLALAFAGIYSLIAVFTVLVLTALQLYLGSRKNG